MIKENKFNQYGFKRSDMPRCIVIHNTGTDYSARELFDYMNNEDKSSRGCHYLIDDKDTIQVMPIDYSVYHTGKGIDYACKYGIAIEICSNINTNKYLNGQKKAITLIKELMDEYNLTKSDIYFHNDFANVRCPKNILDMYGNKKNFIKEEF